MATTTSTPPLGIHEKLNRAPSRIGILIFGGVMILGLVFIGASIARDLGDISLGSAWPYVLLGVALLVALGFEFVNGFHDTANAVATVIYTHSLDPNIAVVWSGFWNFFGVVTSTGAVAFGIVSLLPVELILQVGSNAGFAMVFALLIAAILWNLGTWWFGLPASSSHTLIGSIIGVGIANQLMSVKSGTSGVDWAQALNIGKSLLLSPIFGFILAACLLLVMKSVIKDKRLYEAPEGTEPPPFWIRGLLILTCTGVSFFHGSNDGQKGMGLIMLILIGTVPTTYALNHAVTPRQTEDFIAVSRQAADTVGKYVVPSAVVGDPRDDVTDYIRTKEFKPNTMLALRVLINDIGTEMAQFKQLAAVPREHVRNFRNDMYLVSEALRLMQKSGKPQFAAADVAVLKNYKGHVDKATRFIPLWVKVAVALALGLGTMIGWKRIVVTVGEKIGKNHLTYAQGAAAEITAMATIGAADGLGLPVSTTHVLSSGVAGTMLANSSGLQMGTVRNLLLAWVLTLPAAMTLSGFLFYAFRTMFKG
ncbi:MAG TPA: inorganic phosphate transporter [Candidatus Sulfotelmatobacter sp.]|jgi:PiT family inorganic phosphate transporter|nr:inorganic phosphate transporter [Candidatus Sulfotelmatobacter sp.]